MKTLLSICLLLISFAATAQKSTIKGTTVNENGDPLPAATVMVLQTSDSTLYKFGISNKDGQYLIDGVDPGKYLLQVSFMGYANTFTPIETKGEKIKNVPAVKMKPQTAELGEFAMEAEHTPMKFKEDTVEYNAAAFKTQPEDNVSELLKKLPGVEVDKDGAVKAQGEDVKKILIDGKEFFGDDTKLATENLPADMVAKVQVFDEKSEATKMTGVDDGETEKYINLKIKKNRKKGVFGSATVGGGGTDENLDRYSGKMNLNKFKKNVQMSFLGMANNVNEQGFSYRDYVNFMGGGKNSSRGGGNMYRGTNGQGVPIGSNANDGLTDTYAGGLNFNYDFSKNTSLGVNYFYNESDKFIDRTIDRQFTAGGRGNFSSFESEVQNSFKRNHRSNLIYRAEIDSLQKLTVKANANYSTAQDQNVSNAYNYMGDKTQIANTTNTDNNSTGSNFGFNGEFTYGKRFMKPGRSIVLEGSAGNTRNDQVYAVDFSNQVGDPLSDATVISTSQEQLVDNNQLNYSGEIKYTEPIGKRKYLETFYEYSNFSYQYDKEFYDQGTGTPLLNEILSSKYNNDFNYHRAGLNGKLNTGSSNFLLGAAAQQSDLKGDMVTLDTTISYSMVNILPRFKFTKRWEGSKRYVLNYNTNVREPSLDQLQPTLDNSDPLNLYIGNPDLQPEFRHNIRMRYMSFNQFSFTNLFVMLNGTYTHDKITNQQTMDQSFVQTTSPINVDDDYQAMLYGHFSTPIRKLRVKLNIGANSTYSRSILFMNTKKNNLDRLIHSMDFGFENRNQEKYAASIGTKISLSTTKYDLMENLNQEFVTLQHYFDLEVDIKKTWTLATRFEMTQYQGDMFDDNPILPIWRAYISKRFLKGNKGLLKFMVYDILNQNVGINRTADFNYIQDERVNTLSRYFMLSFTYKLQKFG